VSEPERTANQIEQMIKSELAQRNSFSEICEHWEVSKEDFYEFLERGKEAYTAFR
jgi:predicted DNA-binding protein YlxM (UPF0122 family)